MLPQPASRQNLAAQNRFTEHLIAWQKTAGRHDLPWQKPRDPYRIWLSEIMLQQTQVSTVIPYYARFLASFPDVLALAAAPIELVIAHWAGLGYYARARNLHRCAQQIAAVHGGKFPKTEAQLAELPAATGSEQQKHGQGSAGTHRSISQATAWGQRCPAAPRRARSSATRRA